MEALYLPADHLAEVPVQRATLAGARPLYDPQGIARDWLDTVDQRLAHPPAWTTELAYSRFDLTQTLRTMKALAMSSPDTLVLLRGHLVTELMAYWFRQHRVWAPSLRRQLDALASTDPDVYFRLAACLQAREPQDIVDRCQAAWVAIAGPDGTPLGPFASAPRQPLGGSR